MAAEETAVEGRSRVTSADSQALLRSTLILESGCTAVKVGPKHLLLAARCVAGNAELKAGQTIRFKAAAESSTSKDSASDAGAKSKRVDSGAGGSMRDGGSSGSGDAGASRSASDSTTGSGIKQATIAKVSIHASFSEKCKAEACSFGAVGSSDAKDIAVIVLEKEISSIKSVPIDLDPVADADELLAIGSGCATFDAKPTKVKALETVAAPSKSANHKGSPYRSDTDLTKRLSDAYVVTAGYGWKKSESTLCKSDIGAPLFRGHGLAVAGITSNYTARTSASAEAVPITVHHTRVDAESKVGSWLKKLGVLTTNSCSKSSDGCKKGTYEGGLPDDEGKSSKNPSDDSSPLGDEPQTEPTGNPNGGGSEPPPSGGGDGYEPPPSGGGGGNEPPPSGGGGGNEPPPSGGGGDNEPPPSGGGGDNEPPPSGGGGDNEPPPSGGGGDNEPPPSGGETSEPPSGGETPSGEEGGGWEELPSEGEEGALGGSDGDESGSGAAASEEGDGGASGKKAPKASGCSAAPAQASSDASGMLSLLASIAFFNAVRRRRRSA